MTALTVILKEAAVDSRAEYAANVERVIRGGLIPTIVKAAHEIEPVPSVVEPCFLAVLAVVRLPVDVENIDRRPVRGLLQILPSDVDRRDRGDRQRAAERV